MLASNACSQLSSLVAEHLGLDFPRERWPELERGVAEAAREFGYEDPQACADWLLSAPPSNAQIRVLASHLTIGETYFFRDRPVMEALEGTVLPELIRARRGSAQRLRIWSAACCSGEEAYSVAILLHRLLSDLQDWHVTIAATDINPRFLQKAAAGRYGEWSFRDTPAWLKQRYFERTADGRYSIVPEIRRMVTFAYLNLAKDAFPSLATGTNAMDIVLCRNALMYFAPQRMREVIANLHHALVDGGWLVVSPSEASAELFASFARVNFPGAILFRKHAMPSGEPRPPAWLAVPEAGAATGEFASFDAAAWPAPEVAASEGPDPASDPIAAAQVLYREGRYEQAAGVLQAAAGGHPHDAAAFSLLVHALANQGRLADALAWCERWIAADKLDPAAHYVRAVVLLEKGDAGQARASLQAAIYLDPGFVLAHYALGNLARASGAAKEAGRHFANALELLRRHAPGDPLPESDGLTAGRLTELIASFAAVDVPR